MPSRNPLEPTPADLTAARTLLTRLTGSTPRDRAAFLLGYVLAVDLIAFDLTDAALVRHMARARALHAVCQEDYR